MSASTAEVSWNDQLAGVDWSALAWASGLIIGALVVGAILARLILRAAQRWAARTETRVDDAIARHLRQPLSWLLPVLLLTTFLPLVDRQVPSVELSGDLHHALTVLLTLLVGWLFFRGVRVVEEVINARFDVDVADNLEARAVRTQMRGFRNIAGFLIGVVTLGVALLSFASVRQVGTGLLASAGVAGIVIGFAAQRSISTILAGLQIAISQPIRVDDVVIVEGEWGRIEEITLTYVVVKIWDLRRLIVPIGYFIEKPFQNWTRTSADILGTVSLHLDYSVDVDELRAELERVLQASPHWNREVWGLQVVDSTERSMVVRPLMSAADASAAWDLRCEVREALIKFVQRRYPGALPRLRAELVGDRKAASSEA